MSEPTETEPPARPPGTIDPGVARGILIGLLVLIVLTSIVYRVAIPPRPLPVDISNDPLLAAGFRVFEDRCVSCHGRSGKGDGPIAKGLPGPRVGDLTDQEWKHGDTPAQVEAVIARGVPESAMAGWGSTLGPADLRAVAAYVFHLSGRPVPDEFRKQSAGKP